LAHVRFSFADLDAKVKKALTRIKVNSDLTFFVIHDFLDKVKLKITNFANLFKC
jgi:hypothetical protein